MKTLKKHHIGDLSLRSSYKLHSCAEDEREHVARRLGLTVLGFELLTLASEAIRFDTRLTITLAVPASD